jgi:hypothetical protein
MRSGSPPTRFQNPHFYSSEFDKAIDEFKSDISKLYIAGCTYEEALRDGTAKEANNLLVNKFKSSDKNFPYFKRFVDYVYTRDEAINPFGKWYDFSFLEPLQLFEYAIKLKNDNPDFNGSVLTLASMMFFLIQHRDITPSEEIVALRNRFYEEQNVDGIIKIRGYNEDHLTNNQKKTQKLLRKSRLFDDRSIIINPPNLLYTQSGIGDYRTLANYAEVLGLEYAHLKMNLNNEFTSKLLIHGAYGIWSKFEKFRRSDNRLDKLISQYPSELMKSDFKLRERHLSIGNYIYNELFVRDKFATVHHLENNPFIRYYIKSDDLTFTIQRDFFDFRFLLASLYLKTNDKRNSLRRFIRDMIDEDTRKGIMHYCGNSELKFIDDGQRRYNISTEIDRITSPLDRRKTAHFKQIDNVRSIVGDISKNGINVNLNKLEELETEYSQSLRNTNDDDEEIATSEEYNNIFSEFGDIQDESFYGEKDSKEIFNDIQRLTRDGKCWSKYLQGESKVFGQFTTHGANTHRMTCRKINLQGISSILRETVFKPSPGKILLSADIAGQDIMISAALAKKLYSKPKYFGPEVNNVFHELNSKIDLTLSKLADTSTNEGKPIDFITDNIISLNILELENYTNEKVRNHVKEIVKKAVYSFLYGGGKERFSISKEQEKELEFELADILDAINNLYNSINWTSEELNNYLREIENEKSPREKIESAIKFTDLLNEWILPLLPRYESLFYYEELYLENGIVPRLSKILSDHGRVEIRATVFDKMKEILEREYPGIVESFNFYKKYCEMDDLTYPSLLGWQTVPVLNYNNPGDISTRSKSYPTQASGAEFIREWLIKLVSFIPIEIRRKGSFKILNVIHDQVIVEVSRDCEMEMSQHLIQSAKKAAKSLGINPEIVHFSKIEKIP